MSRKAKINIEIQSKNIENDTIATKSTVHVEFVTLSELYCGLAGLLAYIYDVLDDKDDIYELMANAINDAKNMVVSKD